MNDVPRIPIRIALKGGPANLVPWAECDIHESVYRQRFITGGVNVLIQVGLPCENAGPVAVDLSYRDTGRYTFEKIPRPIFDFVGITDPGEALEPDLH